MDRSELKTFIDDIIKETFKVLTKVYPKQKESNTNFSEIEPPYNSLIVFPETKKDNEDKTEDRISEQELRFIFVEQFNKYVTKENNLFYSIETPTRKYYDFSGPESPRVVPKSEGTGRAANIDLVIYQNDKEKIKRVALIEFKAHNPGRHDYLKDICKLLNEESNTDCLKYFIQIICIKRTYDDLQKSHTLTKICEKIKGNNNEKKINSLLYKGSKNDYEIFYRCCNLRKKEGSQVQKVCGTIKNNKLTFESCESKSTAE